MTRSGFRSALLVAMLLALSACGVRYGMSQGGFPQHIRTVAVEPFENETTSADLPQELLDQLRAELRRSFGLRAASAERADALVRGVLRSYDIDVPVAYSANPTQALSARRRLQVTVDIAIIDQSTGSAIFERKGLRAEGEYPERAEEAGRRQAVDRLVQQVIEGAQSQW